MAGVFGGPKLSKHLEIHLDSPFAVFYGDSHEAEPVAVTGSLVLDSPDHMNVKGVKIKLEGKWRVTWTEVGAPASSNASTTQTIRDKGTLLSEEQQFIPAPGAPVTTHRIAPGKHEWRFKFMLDPNLPESIEGLHGSFVVYNLTAEIDRGYMSKALCATKHVRVVRTLSRDMTETVPFPYSNEDTWADKIKYHIYIPSRYYAFGTSIPVQFTLLPLRKGVKIGKIKMEVLERVGLETDKKGEQTHATTLSDRVVAGIEQLVPRESTNTLVEESTGIADESYHFQMDLPLKRSLNSCRQSVVSDHIKVHHNLKIFVNIHNPDGHVSQLCLRNLIHIYISPHTQINDDQVLASPVTTPPAANFGSEEPALDAPPTYGTHLLDQLYDGIDPAGFISGVATPAHFLSRNHSSENLAAMLANAFPQSGESSDGTSSRASSLTDAAAVQLQSRLAALQDRRPSIPQITEPIPSIGEVVAAEDSLTSQSGTNSFRHSGHFTPHRRRGHSAHPSISLAQGIQIDPFHPSTLASPGSSLNPNSGMGRPRPVSLQPGVRNVPPPAMVFDLEALSRIPSYNTAVRTPYQARTPDSAELPSYDFACGLVAPASPSALATPLPPTPPTDGDESGNPLSRQISPSETQNTALQPSTQNPDSSQANYPLFTNYQGFGGRGEPTNSDVPRISNLELPAPAHMRRVSINDAQVHRTIGEQHSIEHRRKPLGGGSLAGLWQGMRRGSH